MPYKDPDKRRTYHKAYDRAWSKRNRDKKNASWSRWRAKNGDGERARNAERRALGSVDREWTTILRKDPCVYCGEPCEHIDHIIPVVSGGTNDWDNLAPTCKACNLAKFTRSWWQHMIRRVG